MMKFVILFVALFVCTLSSTPMFLNEDCLLHYRMTNPAGTVDIEAYEVRFVDKVMYSLQIHREDPDNVFYELQYLDIPNYYENDKVTVFSNATGICEAREDYYHNTVYFEFKSVLEAAVDCPESSNSTACRSYCDVDGSCIVIDSDLREISYYSTKDSSKTLNFTYYDDAFSLDVFPFNCGDKNYKILDYCTPKKIIPNLPCSGHFKATYFDGYNDVYYMKYGDHPAYVLSDIHTSDSFHYHYYEIIYYNKDFSQRATVLTNSSGQCSYSDDEYEGTTLITEFVYYGDPETVKCPGTDKDCNKYCHFDSKNSKNVCIVVDPSTQLTVQMLEDDYVENYEYFDDVATADMFDMNCDGKNFSAFDICSSTFKKLDLNVSCAGHVMTSDGIEYKYMFSGNDLAYLYVKILDVYVYFDLKYNGDFVWLLQADTESDECLVTKSHKEFLEEVSLPFREFVYSTDPVPVNCSENVTNCTMYTNEYLETSVVVDSNMRIYATHSKGSSGEFSFFDDVPTVDDFSLDCSGLMITVPDVCAEPSSSSSDQHNSSSSDQHNSSSSEQHSSSSSEQHNSSSSEQHSSSSSEQHSALSSSSSKNPSSHTAASNQTSLNSASTVKVALTVIAASIILALF